MVDHERAVIFSVLSDHVKMHVFPLYRDRKQLKTLPLCSTKIIVCPLCSRVFIVFSLSPVRDSDSACMHHIVGVVPQPCCHTTCYTPYHAIETHLHMRAAMLCPYRGASPTHGVVGTRHTRPREISSSCREVSKDGRVGSGCEEIASMRTSTVEGKE